METSFFGEAVMVNVLIGDMFESGAQTLVNTVNTVGVMGKGIALGFRKRFPDMYEDYVRRCARHTVRLGEPYLYRRITPPNIINFPTKDHWRSVSRLSDIVKGLQYLKARVQEWGVTSMAIPPLGCGEGQLEWRVVGPTLYRHLASLEIPVLLYAPFGTPHDELQPEFLHRPEVDSAKTNHQVESIAPFRVEPGWIAIVAIIELVTRERYHWPIGRISFQKVAYYAKKAYESFLMQWQNQITAVADLVVRMNTDGAEIAATVHFAAKSLRGLEGRQPSELEVLQYVQNWKQRRRPPLKDADIALTIRRLNVLGWLDAKPSPELPVPEEAMIA